MSLSQTPAQTSSRDELFNKCYNNFSLHDVVDNCIGALNATKSSDPVFADFLRATITTKRLRESGGDQKAAVLAFLKVANQYTGNKESASADANLYLMAARGGGCAATPTMLSDREVRPAIDDLGGRLEVDLSDPETYRLNLFRRIAELVNVDPSEGLTGLDRELYVSANTALLNEKVKKNLISYEQYIQEFNALQSKVPDYLLLYFFKASNTAFFAQKGDKKISMDAVATAYEELVNKAAEIDGVSKSLISTDINNNDWMFAAPSTSGFAIALDQYRQVRAGRGTVNLDVLIANPLMYRTLGGTIINSL